MADSESGRQAEIDGIKEFQRELANLVKPLQKLTKIPAGRPGDIEQLQLALDALPPTEVLLPALDVLRSRAHNLVKGASENRAKSFGQIEAAFIRGEREAGTNVRETSNGWRLNYIELEAKREKGLARALFSGEPITEWRRITTKDELTALRVDAASRLEKSALSDTTLLETFAEAYAYLRDRKAQSGKGTRIPLPAFYREVQVCLVREAIGDKKRSRSKGFAEFPAWAFLFNLSRYAEIRDKAPEGERLTLETGSQQDHARGLGMIVTALRGGFEPKTYCYVFGA